MKRLREHERVQDVTVTVAVAVAVAGGGAGSGVELPGLFVVEKALGHFEGAPLVAIVQGKEAGHSQRLASPQQPLEPLRSEHCGAGPRGWANVPVVLDMQNSAVSVFCLKPGKCVYDVITAVVPAANMPSPIFVRKGCTLYLVTCTKYNSSTISRGVVPMVCVPFWVGRTYDFWIRTGRFSLLPEYAFWEPGCASVCVCDPWAYAGVGRGSAEDVRWAFPCTTAVLLFNGVASLSAAACGASARKPRAQVCMVLGAAGCLPKDKHKNASSAAATATVANVWFSAAFPTRFADVKVAVDARWPAIRGAVCTCACVGAVAVALNASPGRRTHVFMLDSLVGAHSRRRSSSGAMSMWRQACRRTETLPGVRLGFPEEGLPEPATVTLVQVATDRDSVDPDEVRHYVLLVYTVRTSDRVVTRIQYADPFWNDACVVSPAFWTRVINEVQSRFLNLFADVQVENCHLLLHRQSQGLAATCNACGWLCLQGAARVLLGVVPDVVSWQSIRLGLLGAALAVV